MKNPERQLRNEKLAERYKRFLENSFVSDLNRFWSNLFLIS